MTIRERFHAVMNGDPSVDMYPVIEWATRWDKTVEQWENDGIPRGMDSDGLFRYWGLDSTIQFWFGAKAPDCPLERSFGSGIMETDADYEKLLPFLYPDPKDVIESVKPRIESAMPRYESGESILWYTLDGFFWFPRTLFGIENHLFAFYDNEKLYHRMCGDLAEWNLAMLEEFSAYMKPDFMTFAEDMSYNKGPMVSRALYDEFISPYYKRVVPVIKKHGTRVIIDSDGDIGMAVSWFADAGIEGVLPLEHQAGVDLAKIRADYPEFLMIGGFDKMCMFRGPEAIRNEFERLLPIIRSGRFIPSMDHQTPPGTTIDNYRYYIKLLKEYGRFACKGLG